VDRFKSRPKGEEKKEKRQGKMLERMAAEQFIPAGLQAGRAQGQWPSKFLEVRIAPLEARIGL